MPKTDLAVAVVLVILRVEEVAFTVALVAPEKFHTFAVEVNVQVEVVMFRVRTFALADDMPAAVTLKPLASKVPLLKVKVPEVLSASCSWYVPPKAAKLKVLVRVSPAVVICQPFAGMDVEVPFAKDVPERPSKTQVPAKDEPRLALSFSEPETIGETPEA